MIHDVDESLRTLLERDVLNGAKVDLAFDAPTREWAGKRQGPALNCYLYSIVEDVERRRSQFEERRDARGRVVERMLPPRRFKLSYLVTAWTQRAEDEHRLLSAVLACFLQAEVVPPAVLHGTLADLDEAVRCTVGLPLPPERSISDVWSALGGEMKPSLDLVVTTPFPPLSPRELAIGPPVTERRVRVVDEERREEVAEAVVGDDRRHRVP